VTPWAGDAPTCEAVHDDLALFALGTLTGRDRAVVVDHLATCSDCRVELGSLTRVADALLALTPSQDPPAGFELRLLERVAGATPRRRNGRGVRALSIAAVVVLVAVVGFALGSVSNDHHRATVPPRAAAPARAQLALDGHDRGEVVLSSGSPAWLRMTYDDAGWSGVLWCRVRLTNGDVVDLGRFTVSNGTGAWTAALPVAGDQVRTAQVVDARGAVLGSATLAQ
jgi:hypothetical protein